MDIHDADIFARLIREGDLGFCEAYLEGGWSTPDLQAFMDLVHHDNEAVYDGYPGMAFCAPTRSSASGSSRIRRGRRRRTSPTTTIWGTTSTGSGSTTR
jgi:hypothetical protein